MIETHTIKLGCGCIVKLIDIIEDAKKIAKRIANGPWEVQCASSKKHKYLLSDNELIIALGIETYSKLMEKYYNTVENYQCMLCGDTDVIILHSNHSICKVCKKFFMDDDTFKCPSRACHMHYFGS